VIEEVNVKGPASGASAVSTAPQTATPVSISIVIPTLNESAGLPILLNRLALLTERWPRDKFEIVLVDGGSTDGTRSLALSRVDLLIRSQSGRARQQNAGAAVARHDLLFFLHADSTLPQDFLEQLDVACAKGGLWGRFDVGFDSQLRRYRILAWLMNWRSRLTGICTGDQGLFIRRDLFVQVGGFADIPLMEDIEICRRLRRYGAPFCIPSVLITSSRRWQTNGFVRTVLLMWSLRWRYFFGATPEQLVERYYPARGSRAGGEGKSDE